MSNNAGTSGSSKNTIQETSVIKKAPCSGKIPKGAAFLDNPSVIRKISGVKVSVPTRQYTSEETEWLDYVNEVLRNDSRPSADPDAEYERDRKEFEKMSKLMDKYMCDDCGARFIDAKTLSAHAKQTHE